MTAHSSGNGASWNETLDVDQPHGLDYQEWNDIRVGVRKRMSQEHNTFADSTVGGIHKPGRTAVLEIGDATPPATRDGSYGGHGILWDNSSRLWCWTAVAGATAAPGVGGTADWTIVKIHPDKQWGGGDITWTGNHEFDGSVDITGNTTVGGALIVEGSSDISDTYVDGDISVKGSAKVATDFSLTGDLAVDGTSNFTGDVAFAADVSIDGKLVVDDFFDTTAEVQIFGDWTTKSTDNAALAKDITYQASGDGYLTLTATASSEYKILSDSAANVTTIRSADTVSAGGQTVSATVPVKKDWYVAISAAQAPASVLWLPIGDASLEVVA